MKQFLIRTTVLMIVVITVCCLSSACAESISVGDSKTFAVTLTDSPPFKKGTVLLDNNITLRSHSERALMLQIQSLVIDGQDHALTPGANVSQDDEISLTMRDKGYLKLQNISDLGNMSVFGLKGTVEFENVMLTGNSYTFLNAHATLSSADTAVRDKAGKPSSIYVSKTLSSQKPMLVLDENCRIAENWMLRTVNAELQVDCDYYDAEVEAFAKGSVSFSGKGIGKGQLSVMMLGEGKATVNAQTEKLRIIFSGSDPKGSRTVSVTGSAHSVKIQINEALQKSRKLNLNLSDVNELRFVIWLTGEKRDVPVTDKEKEDLHKMMHKAVANMSLKKVKNSDGKPIKNVTYEISGQDEKGTSWKEKWTEELNGK